MVEECNFSFAGKESFDYGIFLANVGNIPDTLVSGVDSEIISASVSGNSSRLIYGVKENDSLKFEITLMLPRHCTFETMCDIKHWLFGQNKPQALKFHHPDLEDYYFQCFFRYGEDWHIEGIYKAMKVSIECVSPYANKQDISFVISSAAPTSIFIDSAELCGIKPKISFIVPSNINQITINSQFTNTSLKVKSSSTHTLTEGDNVFIDCQRKIITINHVLSIDNLDFSDGYGFVSFVDGNNIIEGTNGVDITFTYTPTRRIGGV